MASNIFQLMKERHIPTYRDLRQSPRSRSCTPPVIPRTALAKTPPPTHPAGQLDGRLTWMAVCPQHALADSVVSWPPSPRHRLCTHPLIHLSGLALVTHRTDDSDLIRPHGSARSHSERPLLSRLRDERNAARRHHDHARGCHRAFHMTSAKTFASHLFPLLEHA